ncbi:MAG TPA: hypothetical protein VLS25_05780 [Dehalococcoidia bacterium]|nr:hypothetical protein [Dehalococcoidia bacterium]
MDEYGALFRDAYSLLHGGRGDEADDSAARRPGEGLGEYLARTRSEAVGTMRKRLLAASPPAGLEKVHGLLADLLEKAAQGDEALARQVAAYQCGNFHESVTHSERLHELVTESARLDRELIVELRSLPVEVAEGLGIGGFEEV